MTEREFNNLMNEGGEGYLPPSENEKIFEAEMAAERASWTKEATAARRTAWNAELAVAKKVGRKVDLHRLEAKMGFRLVDLKDAVKRHGL